MPLFMDRHYVEGATRSAVAHAHELDLAVQEKYGVQFLTYWFDEPRSTVFCLINSPDRETLQRAHDEAHGLVPHEIVEVDPSIVEAFLGRIQDPVTPAADTSPEAAIDSAFRAILFTDMADSTVVTNAEGDARGLHLVRIHNALVRSALRECNGREVKHTGDGIMASFADVEASVHCARAIQQAIAAHNAANPEDAITVRIGISAGEPIEEEGDLFGTVVQLASRLCSHAEPGQVIVSDIVRSSCPGLQEYFKPWGQVLPKGFDTPVAVHAVSCTALSVA